MKMYNKKGNQSTIRQIRNDAGDRVLAIMGTTTDLMAAGIINECCCPREYWVCIYRLDGDNYEIFSAATREEILAVNASLTEEE